ncbi:MAG: hypothetical protein ACOY4K_16265 [Pseudomonadota bacterium]
MIQFAAALGLIIAGLFILWTRGLPVLRAVRTGVWTSKTHGRPNVERDAEPERFSALIKERSGALTPAAVMIVIGVLLFAQGVWVVSAVERRAQEPSPYLDAR